jgi:hypothetical protein
MHGHKKKSLEIPDWSLSAPVSLVMHGREQFRISRSSFGIDVRQSHTLGTLIRAGGYDWLNRAIYRVRFNRIDQSALHLDVVLVQFENPIPTLAVLCTFRILGLRPLGIRELLVFGATYPTAQHKHMIVALGSQCVRGDGRQYVACLDWSARQHRIFRGLNLHRYDNRWNADYLFTTTRYAWPL